MLHRIPPAFSSFNQVRMVSILMKNDVFPILPQIQMEQNHNLKKNGERCGRGHVCIQVSPASDKIIKDRNKRKFSISALKPVLYLGKFLGIVAINGLNQSEDPEQWWSTRIGNPWSLIPLSVMAVGILNVGAMFITFEKGMGDQKSFTESVEQVINPVMNGYFLLIYILSWTRRSRLLQLLKDISTLSSSWNLELQEKFQDKNLRRDCIIITILIMLHGVGENLLSNIAQMSIAPQGDNILATFYSCNTMEHLRPYIPYNPILVLIYIVYEKLTTYSWSYLDILIIFLSRMVAHQYQVLKRGLELHFQDGRRGYSGLVSLDEEEEDDKFLSSIHSQFLKIHKTTRDFSRFFSPFMVAMFFANLYCISIHLYRWLTGRNELNDYFVAYIRVSSVQFVVRLLLVTFTAAEVHHKAQHFGLTLQTVTPTNLKSPVLSRIEKTMQAYPLGIDIHGIFMITRHSILSFVSFLFSFQIVLLQATPEKELQQ